MCIETVSVLGHASAVIAVYTYSGKLFEGENFRANFESFLREIWGRRVLWRGKKRAIRESFVCENRIYHKVFSLESFSLYSISEDG